MTWPIHQDPADARNEAHAPYNFVPLPELVVTVDDLPTHDQYHTDRLTGQVIWYENFGNPRLSNWTQRIIADLSPGMPDAIEVIDLDQNGTDDLLVGTEAPDGSIYWLTPNNVRLSWQANLISATGFEVGEFQTGIIADTTEIDFATTIAGSTTPAAWFQQN